MAKRKIIRIDEDKCTGCGLCIPNCPEGALQIIDGKARLVNELFCDGLGACIGYCPQGAIITEEREARDYDERKVIENIIKQGKGVIKAHLKHLKDHRQAEYLKQALEVLKEKKIEIPDFEETRSNAVSGCPGSKTVEFTPRPEAPDKDKHFSKGVSHLRQWPVQIRLVPPFVPYLKGADLLIAADCTPFAYGDFHRDLLRGRILLIGCPKLDDIDFYRERLTQIFKNNAIKSITCAHMEVPCCFGLRGVIKEAVSASGKNIPFEEVTISIKGEWLK